MDFGWTWLEMREIKCPRCGKTVGEDHSEFIQLGRERNRIYKPICPKAIELTCPDSRCKRLFDLSEVLDDQQNKRVVVREVPEVQVSQNQKCKRMA